jgi:hypothetical protein
MVHFFFLWRYTNAKVVEQVLVSVNHLLIEDHGMLTILLDLECCPNGIVLAKLMVAY